MKKNHWHTAGSKQRQAAYKYGYRSGLELLVAEQIKSTSYELRWTATDRKKMKHVLQSNPGVDIRMVFQNPNQRISKASKTTYEVYANKLGITHVSKKTIPEEWMAECVKQGESVNNPKQFLK